MLTFKAYVQDKLHSLISTYNVMNDWILYSFFKILFQYKR